MAKKRKAAYRRQTQNRLSMVVALFVIAVILIAVSVKSSDTKAKIEVKQQEIAALQEQIDAQNLRSEEIERRSKEVQTKGYIEQMAREKLGLVYEGEILFKEEK